MIIENLLPTLLAAAAILAISSIALVQFIFGRYDYKLFLYSFTLLGLTASTLSLKWLERSGQIPSNQDNTSIFLFICLLLLASLMLGRRFRTNS